MSKKETKALQMIARTARCPEYSPARIEGLMSSLGLNERSFALLMNVTPHAVRLWTSGVVRPSGTAKRLMQLYEIRPEIVGTLAESQSAAEGSAQ